MMPGCSTRKRSAQSQSQPGKHQQLTCAAGDRRGRNEQPRKPSKTRSQAAALAACGAKRKRHETNAADEDLGADEVVRDVDRAGAAVGRPGTAGSEQHKANAEGPERLRRSGRHIAKVHTADRKGQPSEDGAKRPATAPAISSSQAADSIQQPRSPTGQGINRAATAAAVAAATASFGRPRVTGPDRPASAPSLLATMIPSGTGVILPRAGSNCQSVTASASQSARPTGLASLVPASQGAGLNSLASTLFKRQNQSGCTSGRPPKPPSSQQLAQASVPTVRQSSRREPVPHPQLPTDSHGPASFPYFKEGFMTQPFSVSAFAAESKEVLGQLEDFLSEAALLQQDQGEAIEAASLRVAPLEEQRQAAVQVVLAEAKATSTQGSKGQPSAVRHPNHSNMATANGLQLGSPQSGIAQSPSSSFFFSPAQQTLRTSCSVAGTTPGVVTPSATVPRGGSVQCSTPSAAVAPLSEASRPSTRAATAAAVPGSCDGAASVRPVAPSPVNNTSTAADSVPNRPAAAGSGSGTTLGARNCMSTGLTASEDTDMAEASTVLPAVADAAAAVDAAVVMEAAHNAAAAAQADTPTAAPVSATAAPDGTTAAPDGTASALAGTTAAPANTTAPAPVSITAAPDGIASAPASTTAAPASTTALAPVSIAAAPDGTASAPASTTDTPVITATAAEQTTPAPVNRGSQGTSAGQSRTQSPAGRSGPRAAAAAHGQAKAHAEAQKEAEAEVNKRWQEGLDEAAESLESVKMTSKSFNRAADKRWSRNLGANPSTNSAWDACDQDPHLPMDAGNANIGRPLVGRNSARGSWVGATAPQAPQGPPVPRPPDDIVLTFSIHRFDRPGWKLMDVAVLSSQKLTALRDVITCEADANMTAQKQSRPSGYFYIEGDFYNDMRNDGRDLSLEVRQYCRDQSISVPPPQPASPPACPPGSANAPYFSRSTQSEPRTKSMEDTTFNDLYLRVGQGAGYVYVHQGCCEHLLELTDVRSAHDADPLLINHFPQVLGQAKRMRRNCCICNPDGKASDKADWVTHHDRNAPSNPTFWCDGCYRQMHYTDKHDLLYAGYIAMPYRYELGTLQNNVKKRVESPEDCNDDD